jgi:hypothetical protein
MPESTAVKGASGDEKVKKIDPKDTGSESGTDSDSDGSVHDGDDTGPTSEQSKVRSSFYSS